MYMYLLVYMTTCTSAFNTLHPPPPSLSFPSSLSLSRDQFIVFSGGAPYDLVDGDCVSVWDGRETTALQLTSPVRGMHIVEDIQSDMDSGIVGAASEMDNVSTGGYIVTRQENIVQICTCTRTCSTL